MNAVRARTTAARLPRWVRLGVGFGGVVLGGWSVTSPAVSLAVHAVLVPAVVVTAVLARRWSRRVAAAGGLLTAGAAAAATAVRPTVAVGVLVVGVAVGLIVAAVAGLARGRGIGALGAAAGVGLGLLVLLWPDVAALVIAVVAGPVTVAGSVAVAVGGRRRAGAPARHRRPRWPAQVVALGALGVVGWLLLASVTVLGPGTGPGALPSTTAAPGTLTASAPLDPALGVPGWRITYATTRADGAPTLATGLVLVPPGPPGPRPVIAWAHGSVGYPARCAPSAAGDPVSATASGAPGPILAALAQGWVVVAADYTAAGSADPPPYLVGEGEARAVLDSVRAAAALPVPLALDRVTVWGHSQGGHAALWAAARARDYAPGIGVLGVAALAAVVDLPAVVDDLDTTAGGSIFLAGLVSAYADTYPDVAADRVVRPGTAFFLSALAARCLTEPAAAAPLTAALLWPGPMLDRPLDAAFARRLRDNVTPPPSGVPVFLAHGAADVLVRTAVQEAAAGSLCASGVPVGYRAYPGLDHAGLVAASSPLLPDLVAWTATLQSGARPASAC